jgi:hypothetical protein
MAGISVARGETVVTSNRRLAGKMGCGGDVVFPGLELELQALSSRVRQDNHLASDVWRGGHLTTSPPTRLTVGNAK